MKSGNPPLRLAVIGCGLVAQQCHLPVLRTLPDIDIVALVDADRTRLDVVANRVGVQRRYEDYRGVLNDSHIDVVAVCVPPHLHAEIGLAALDAGKHLLMEKPLALSLDEAEQLVERSSRAPVKALVGFNLRWHRLVRAARSVIDDGSLGALEMVHTTFNSMGGWRTPGSGWRRRPDLGGGVIFDLGIHHFDLWRLLVRSEVEEVFAQHRSNAASECVTVSAVMANGVQITGSFSHGLTDTNELDICGRRRRLRLSCYRFDSLHVSDNAGPQGAAAEWLKGVGRAARNAPRALSWWRRGGDVLASYRAEWQHLISAIRNDAPVECPFEEARRALHVALATVESASSGRPVSVATAGGATASGAPAPIPSAARVSRTAGQRER